MEEEIWKDIENCAPYQISNLGRIRNTKTTKYLNPSIRPDGYIEISIQINNKTKKCKVHRLIAQAFIPNPENKPTVNHIDRNRSNNAINNLEWATMSEQNYHSAKIARNINYFSRKIIQKTLDNKYIDKFDSIKDASLKIYKLSLTKFSIINDLNISIISSKICAVANKKRKNAYGFIWEYDDNKYTIIEKEEIWKEIPKEIIGVNNYFISNLCRFKTNKNIIKYTFPLSNGYYRVGILEKCFLLHRLVALTFLENPLNKEHVNHIDGNKLNNNLDNLEWATCLENNLHKIKTGLSNCTKKVSQYDKNDIFIKEYDSIIECAKELNVSSSCISNSCSGKTQTNKTGFKFRYS